jgi:hypothetical protein
VWRSSFVKVAASIESDADKGTASLQPIGRELRVYIERPEIYVGRESGIAEIRTALKPLPDGDLSYVQKRAVEHMCAIRILRNHSIGMPVSVGFTSDAAYVGKVVNVRSVDNGRREGMFLAEDLGTLRRLFTEIHQMRAEMLIDRFLFDPDAFLIPRSTCLELEIKDGEHLSLMKNPTAQPIENLLR